MVITRSGHNTNKISLFSFTEEDWSSVYPVRQGLLPYFPSDREFAISVLNIARKRNPFNRIMSTQRLNNLSDAELTTYLHEMIIFEYIE